MESHDSEFSEAGGYAMAKEGSNIIPASWAVTFMGAEWYTCEAHLAVTAGHAVLLHPQLKAEVRYLGSAEPRSCWGHAMNWPFTVRSLRKRVRDRG